MEFKIIVSVMLMCRAISRLAPGPLLAVVATAVAGALMGWGSEHLTLLAPIPHAWPLPQVAWTGINGYELQN